MLLNSKTIFLWTFAESYLLFPKIKKFNCGTNYEERGKGPLYKHRVDKYLSEVL